jgi:release factor glutamine methyltransferase
MTLRDALVTATARLRDVPALRDEAAEDSTLLLLHILGISRAALLTGYDRTLTPGEQTAYLAAITRRLTHEPVQYITGEREFYGLPFAVTPAVLIPRNLTEHLVDAVLAELTPYHHPWRIADVGAGSGAIAIALASHLPHAIIAALDNSPTALSLVAENAIRNNVAARVRCIESNLLESLAGEPPLDAIVSNPPYIPQSDLGSLAPQVRDFEPHAALFAGPDGLEIYRRLIPQAHAALKPNGLLALEIGPGQREAIATLLTGWNNLRFILDFDQTPRIALARKP